MTHRRDDLLDQEVRQGRIVELRLFQLEVAHARLGP